VWVIKSLFGIIKLIFLICLFEEEKFLKLKLTMKGYVHGVMKYFISDPENIIKLGGQPYEK